MSQAHFELIPIGRVESSLTDTALAPKQGDEGAPDAWLVFEPHVLEALEGIGPGIASSSSPGSTARAATCSECIPATTSPTPREECSAPDPPIGRTRSVSMRWRLRRSKVNGFG